MKCKECNSEALRHSQLCAYCLVMRDNIIRRPRFALKVLTEYCHELQRLEAIASRIEEYDQHTIQAKRIRGAGPILGDFIAEDEELFAKEALDEAVKLVRRN